MTTAMLITMIACFAISVSIAVSIGLASVVGIVVAEANMLVAVKEIFNSINKFPLAAIPFFILAGNLMEAGGISQRLVEFAKRSEEHTSELQSLMRISYAVFCLKKKKKKNKKRYSKKTNYIKRTHTRTRIAQYR